LASYCGLWIFHFGAEVVFEKLVRVEAREVVELFDSVDRVLWLLVGREDASDLDMIWAIEDGALGAAWFRDVGSIFEVFSSKKEEKEFLISKNFVVLKGF
jgi:hypothetical protein